ncbi:hypothetical protein SAMN05216344_11949 [Polaromonas sp. OV174]|uniref:hypothetical protein n=1 Tax=Polaromonas sp. OV174 TaxID=1855300 RepID=UPI0008EFA487|nr:hypothetical protein [Polaromonas sp. OV174]SFC49117.1 hypothetical protein SAMN05216344_11949 [Polaromonas sp. OV174]
MRFLLFALMIALMIALLPLRGWVGDAMAMEMALTQLQSPQHAMSSMASPAHEVGMDAHAMQQASAAEAPHAMTLAHDCAGDDASHAASAHCESCSVCQTCHTVALSPAVADASRVFSAPTMPRLAAAPFASADAALSHKPPIS